MRGKNFVSFAKMSKKEKKLLAQSNLVGVLDSSFPHIFILRKQMLNY